jgi:hypothetical protein
MFSRRIQKKRATFVRHASVNASRTCAMCIDTVMADAELLWPAAGTGDPEPASGDDDGMTGAGAGAGAGFAGRVRPPPMGMGRVGGGARRSEPTAGAGTGGPVLEAERDGRLDEEASGRQTAWTDITQSEASCSSNMAT